MSETPPIPGFRLTLTWRQIGAICSAIVVPFGVLIGIIYYSIDHRISDVQTDNRNLNQSVNGAAHDAGSLQTLLQEARNDIQDTHDAVIRYEARFDTIDKSLTELKSAVSDI
jgi:hypothetical protein